MVSSMSKERAININISPKNRMQTIDGWGTSLCWWANVVGNWQDEKKINEIADLIFSHEKGLGINITRYNIGAGENPPNVGNLRVGADMPCFKTEKGDWNWAADAGQRKVLFKAKERGANYFEAFSNAPPVWMSKSGSTSGASDRRNNLKEDKYVEFADFLTEVVKHYKEEWGLTFDTIAPFNEPISCWWHDRNNQEGCFFDTDKQIEIMEEVIEKLKAKGLEDTIVTGPEGWSVFDSIYSYGCYTDKIKSHMTRINTHGYNGDNNSRTFLKSIADKDGKKLWMSETGSGGTEPHNHNDITGPLELAKLIRDYLVEMNASAWVYWQVVENELLNHNHGLIHANFSGSEEYWITKQYYAFANYSKFIREGTTILGIDDVNTVAAYDEKAGQLILVLSNDEEVQKEYICDLSSFNNMDKYVKVYRTSKDENLAQLQDILIQDKTLKINLKEKSISTYLIASIEV